MVIIKVKEEDKNKVLGVLLGNGRFRSLGDNMFDIIEHSEEVLKKLKELGIETEPVEE